MNVITLLANDYVFLTVCAGETLQNGDSVKVVENYATRMLEEARGKLTQVGGVTVEAKLEKSTYEIVRA